jgi:D-3-phosphoglycerate dehydrogenase
LALILASRRNIATEAERMKRGDLPRAISHRLRGSTLGVFGLGTIGSLVAEAGAGFGMKVLVFGRSTSLEKAKALGYAAAKTKAQLFEESDVLTLQVRLTPDTRGVVTREDLGRMKPSALFVNTARAELVQPGALLASLREGRPGFAALDVYEEEPVPRDHPLLAMSNVLCTPHLGWAEFDNFELYFGECFEQIADWARTKAKA